ncbi:sensor histidine kinase [Rhizobium lusitanum]|jgi:signal transduction histidine kinase|uniref:sensor histidine kinase n=2 Tax=Rhizobium TaxID=379 RepID=UPI0009E0031B|nr:HAMP domain-containing sensor histidine kinase [Rhizobium lusitanum]NTJ09735.1 HAMP domain-containing histidine kinase [Rhizobium lusitanum]
MVDAFSGLGVEPMGGLRRTDGSIVALLDAAVQFSGAARGLLLCPGDKGLFIHTSVGGSNEAPFIGIPSSMPMPHQTKAAMEATSLGASVVCAHQGEAPAVATACLAVPMGQTSLVSSILYLEMADDVNGFSASTVQAIELYASAFEQVLRLQEAAVGSAQVARSLPETGSAVRTIPYPMFENINPITLAGVAETIAHKINDSLSAVVAHASAGLHWLNQDPPKVEKARRSLRKIAASTFSVGSVMGSYRSATGSGGSALELIDVSSCVQAALEILADDLIEADVKSECDFSQGAAVLAEAKQIEQAITTLVSVALDSMKKVQGPRRLNISSTMLDNELVISLSDSGQSIPLEARDAIFDPSYSSKQGGRGIKLAIARTIAQLHGGNLEIARSDDRGTTMLFKLPLRPDRSPGYF